MTEITANSTSGTPAEATDASPETAPSVRDNKALRRFELDAHGEVAFASYRRSGGHVVITHTETPPPLRGRGIAGMLYGVAAVELFDPRDRCQAQCQGRNGPQWKSAKSASFWLESASA